MGDYFPCEYGREWHSFKITFSCCNCNYKAVKSIVVRCKSECITASNHTYMIKAVGCSKCQGNMEMCFNCEPGIRDDWCFGHLEARVENVD